jgi:glycosyltransferase involved in cell wall biosynthesis
VQRSIVLYVGAFGFPARDAGAAMVLGIGKALRSLGYEVVFGGGESDGRPEDRVGPSAYRYQGFGYAPQGGLDKARQGSFGRILEIRESSRRTLRWIDTYRERGIAAIIGYGVWAPLLLPLRRYTRRHRIPLILDIVEWPTGRNLTGGTFGPQNIESEFRLRFLNRKSDGVIAISSLLTEYYRSAGCPVVRIPPLVDLDEQKWSMPVGGPSDSLRMIYAGNARNKDLLGNIIRGVVQTQARKRRIELHLVGVTKEQTRELSGCDLTQLEEGDSKVICHGGVPQNDVPAMLSQADFSVLLRPDNKASNAGFATKLVESLSAGTPAIVNPTSDISEYVKDGQEGWLVRGNSPEALAATLDVVAELPQQRIAEMRRNAKNRARTSFDYSNYCSGLRDFLREASSRMMVGAYESQLEEVGI